MNKIDVDDLRRMQKKAYSNKNISDIENEELNMIHTRIEELNSINNLSIEQFKELSTLVSRSGFLIAGEYSQKPYIPAIWRLKRRVYYVIVGVIIGLLLIGYKAINA